MTDRDRLIELIATIVCKRYAKDVCFSKINKTCGECESGRNFQIGDIADHLIANAVTVGDANDATTTWRPASEPPKEDGRYLVLITSFSGKHTWQDVCKFSNNLEKVNKFDFKGVKCAGWYDYEDGDYYEVNNITHWMPLPQPPKGVE